MKITSPIVLVVGAIAAAAAVFMYGRSDSNDGFIVEYPITQIVHLVDMRSPSGSTEFNHQTRYEGYSASTDPSMPPRLVFRKIIEENASYLEVWAEEGLDSEFKGRIQLLDYNADHGGFTTLDIVTLVFNSDTSEPAIQLTQTWVPGNNDDLQMPGPPEDLIYQFVGDGYELMAAN